VQEVAEEDPEERKDEAYQGCAVFEYYRKKARIFRLPDELPGAQIAPSPSGNDSGNGE
jgi:hypothetical protein